MVFLGAALFSYGKDAPPRDPDEAFTLANTLYEKGEYKKAVAEDESILAEGFKSGNLYYNLGNAYFKGGDLGRAVLNYERALRLMPRDSDLVSNYRLAKSLVKQKNPSEKRMIVLKWLDRGMEYITLRQAIIMATFLYFILVIYIIVTRVFKKYKSFSIPIIILILLLFITVLVPLAKKLEDFETGGVVVAKITDARFEPEKDAMVHFPLYEGMKVYITRRKGDWYKVSRPDGKLGWVDRSEVSLIGM